LGKDEIAKIGRKQCIEYKEFLFLTDHTIRGLKLFSLNTN